MVKRRTRILFGVSVLLLIVGGAAFARWRYIFPFGEIHRCDTALYLALRNYASTHGGRFPHGESTPEASLSLLYREKFVDADEADILRAITVPKEVITEQARSGQLLNADTCGWHYVEGLRDTDSTELALFWDKAGLGHWGERLEAGGYIVTFVSGSKRHVPASQWAAFLEIQRKLLASCADAQ